MIKVTEIVRSSLKLAWERKNLWWFAALWLLPSLVMPSDGGGFDIERVFSMMSRVLVSGLIGAFVSGAVTAGIASKTTTTVRDQARQGRFNFSRLLGLHVLSLGLVLLAVAVVAVPCSMASAAGMSVPSVIAIGAVLSALIAYPTMVWFFATTYAKLFVVLRGYGPIEALRAGRAFLHGRLLDTLRLFVSETVGQIVAVSFSAPAVLALAGLGFGVTWLFAPSMQTAAIGAAVAAAPLALLATLWVTTFRSTVWGRGFLALSPDSK